MINFCFGIHNHQPVGNFDSVIAKAYKRCYLPFIKLLLGFPDIKVTLHNTGVLWDWFEENHPEYFEYIEKLLALGQLELLGGGYYEPILPAIFDSHKKGQINKLSVYLKKKFCVTPRGMWMAERVWEPQLAGVLADCGMEYTILDDTHFRWAGLTERQLDGYFITEEQHKKLSLFPISKELRYAIPFKPVDEVIDIYKRMAERSPGKLAIYADDGEKFGIWPDTYHLCYEEKWLGEFFEELSKNADWLRMTFFCEAMDEFEPNGRVYLPTSSYAEMGQWSLPPAGFIQFEELENWLKDNELYKDLGYLVHGGFWRCFLTKYPEANNMHKKMYRVAARIDSLKNRTAEKKELAEAEDLLYQGQCNCPYWHGVFGGLYLNHLRYATYNRFIRAEAITDKLGALPENGDIEVTDFDDDGHDEILVETKRLNAYFSPHRGGSLFELDLKNKGMNLLDTMARRKEGYHHKLSVADNPGHSAGKSIHDRVEVKEEGLEKYLVYDWHNRVSFIEHITSNDITLEQLAFNEYRELGDFIIEPFEYRIEKSHEKLTVTMSRDGHIYQPDGTYDLMIKKNFDIYVDRPMIKATYTMANQSNEKIDIAFGIELNWAMLTGDAPDRYYYIENIHLDDDSMKSTGENADVKLFGIKDDYHKLDIRIGLSEPCLLRRFPIETVNLSESGFERVYQSSVTCPFFDIRLSPGQKRKFAIKVEFFDL